MKSRKALFVLGGVFNLQTNYAEKSPTKKNIKALTFFCVSVATAKQNKQKKSKQSKYFKPQMIIGDKLVDKGGKLKLLTTRQG